MTLAVPRPDLDEARVLTGELPSAFPPTAASLALQAGRLIVRYEPWWTIKCGYNWIPTGGSRMEWDPALNRLVERPAPIENQLHRASIPASIWAALAFARSGGNEAYYREDGVRVAGLFAIPVDIAALEGFDPMSVFDALRYTRQTIEGTILAWRHRQVPGPACPTLADYLYCALFQHLAGNLAATAVFATVLQPTQTAILEAVRTGAGFDWNSASFAGVGRDGVATAAIMASDIVAASYLLEGWDFAARPGVVGLNVDEEPQIPTQGEWINHWPSSGQMQPSTRRTTGGPEAIDTIPSGVSFLRTAVPRIYPWENPDDETARSGFDIDPYQLGSIKLQGHYPTRLGVLEVLVPSVPGTDGEQPPATTPPTTPGSGRTWLVAALTLLGVSALGVGAVVLVGRPPQRRPRRRRARAWA